MTNCPNCGAPITGFKCQYCGAIIFDFASIEVGKPVWINFKLGEHWVLAHVLPESASISVEPMDEVVMYADGIAQATFRKPAPARIEMEFIEIPTDRGCSSNGFGGIFMTNVEIFIDELGKLPHDNGSNLTWFVETDPINRVVKIVMKDRSRKPTKTKAQFCSFDDVYESPDPRRLAALVIEDMYYDFGEHIVDTKLLMSLDEAADILREFTKGFEEYGAWDIEDDVLVTALKVAIKCLEVTL